MKRLINLNACMSLNLNNIKCYLSNGELLQNLKKQKT